VLLLVGLCAAAYWSLGHQPRYEGRKVTAWFHVLTSSNSSSTERLHALKVFRSMDSGAVPILIHILRRKENGIDRAYDRLYHALNLQRFIERARARASGYAFSMSEREFEQVVAEGRALQGLLPDLGLVAVGGTAAALHCRHRVSLDVDEVTPQLRARYTEVLSVLETWEGWKTNRRNPPILILGERHGVELGLRQQRRSASLEKTQVDGLWVATAPEMLRVKAFLLAERRATRDYIDLAALAERLGETASLNALALLNLLYPSDEPQTMITRLAEACESEPADLAAIPLHSYKGLQAPFTDWTVINNICRRLGHMLLKRELEGSLPQSI
jgi:hypothetical protein